MMNRGSTSIQENQAPAEGMRMKLKIRQVKSGQWDFSRAWQMRSVVRLRRKSYKTKIACSFPKRQPFVFFYSPDVSAHGPCFL